MTGALADGLIFAVAALAILGVIVRPWRAPEALWACLGAAVLVLLGLIAPPRALAGVAKGTDVYLFLAGMMLLSEIARLQGLFDWVAGFAVNHARGSPRRLFALVYLVGIVVTAVLSNDATAVVLTPAVFAAARKAGADPLPHLFACALVANAASFLLPISNPANLVLYASRTPPLGPWLASFLAPSLLAVGATFALLLIAERRRLAGDCAPRVEQPRLSRGGGAALIGLVITAVVLVAVSGTALAFASNLTNNLPGGLLAAATAKAAHAPRAVTDALLIGVDLGPNLSVTGSLATILWLKAIRREGQDVGFWRFLKVGALVMPPALALAIGARVLLG